MKCGSRVEIQGSLVFFLLLNSIYTENSAALTELESGFNSSSASGLRDLKGDYLVSFILVFSSVKWKKTKKQKTMNVLNNFSSVLF